MTKAKKLSLFIYSNKTNNIINQLFKWSLISCLSISVLTTLTVIIIMGKSSWDFFQQVSVFDFLFGTEWTPLFIPKSFGVLPLVAGTAFIVLGAIFIALPLGLMVAIYLSEYAPTYIQKTLKPFIEVLAGIPTVVYGYFALTFITPQLKFFFPETQLFNALSAAIVVGIMILPMISSLSEDAFSSISNSLREGGYALGATQFEVITQIILPASIRRIGASIILAISRAVGETMAVALAAGSTPKLFINPLESIQTMTAYIIQVSLGDTPANGIEYLTCFAVGGLLFLITLTFNIIGIGLIRKC